ncbi:DUF4294 domain-containing protein [Chitinophagaceae bacterium MMS25-I14]
MFYRFLAILILSSALCFRPFGSSAQHSAGDTIRLGAFVVAPGDTAAMVYLDEFVKTAKMLRRYARQKAEWDRLHYNVYKVYPYAVIAAGLLKDVDVNLDKIPDKKGRKEYLKSVEKELNKRFKGELEDLTIQQGQILVKLIDRQTGKNCYSIIREVKGGFSAVIWQSVALLFSNNLKREYDPYDRDKDIEAVVREIEERNYYRYQYQIQSKSARN